MLFPIQAINRKKQLISEAIAPASSGLLFLVDEANMVWLVAESEMLYYSYKDILESYKQEIETNRIVFVYFFSCPYNDELSCLYERAVAEYQPSLNFGRTDNPLSNLGYNSGEYIDRYNDISSMIKVLKVELDELKPNIVALLEDSEDSTYSGDGFKITLQKRPTYDYSAEAKALEKQLKLLKKAEEDSGKAKVRNYSVFPVIKSV